VSDIASARPRTAARKILDRGLAVILGVVIALVVAELGLRLIGYSHPDFYVLDLDRGHALRPGAAGPFTDEGKSFFTVNSDGLHDRERPKAKPANTLRVAVLGDSFAEAKQVPMGDNFSSVLERELGKCDALHGKRVEVINFGVSAYGTTQELITMREHVWDYSPDIVVLAFYTGNDVSDNSARYSGARASPVFVRRDGNWQLDYSFRNIPRYRKALQRQSSIGTWFEDHSRIGQLIKNAARIAGAPAREASAEEDRRMYSPPADPDLREGWDATEYMLSVMDGEVRAHHATFLLVTLSNGIQVYPDPRVRAAFTKKPGIVDLFYPEHRLGSFASRENIDILSLAEPFQRYAEKHGVFLHGFHNTIMGYGHWNSAGHRLAGMMIANRLCTMLGGHPTAEDADLR